MDARFIDRIKYVVGAAFVSHSIWQRINRPVYHPIAKHFLRQLKRDRAGPSVIAVALLAALILILAVARLYGSVGSSIRWTMPLWLMLYSLIYSARWIYRIVLLISRQGRNGVLDEVSVIPPGRVFIFLAICKVVLHEQDALAWVTMLRKFAAGILFLALALPVLITLPKLESIDTSQLSLLLIELSLLSFVIVHEHKQSVVLASLLPMTLSHRLKGQIDGTSLVMVCYIVLQILSFALALAIPAAIGAIDWRFKLSIDIAAIGMAMMLALFLLIREMIIWSLWRTVLSQTNSEKNVFSNSTHVGNAIGANALGSSTY